MGYEDNKMWNNKTMTYVVLAIVILFVILFFVFVFNQGEEKSIKSFFQKTKSLKNQSEEQDENEEEIVNKNINDDISSASNDKCKNKFYKKLGHNCQDKYIPPI